MKRHILSGLAGLAVVSVALGSASSSFVNNSVLIFPPSPAPVIDATNFINNSAFIDNSFNSAFLQPYETTHTVNYTNFGVMGALEGFRFDTYYPPPLNRYTSAGTLYNAPAAIINCGGTNDGAYFTTNIGAMYLALGSGECIAWATNIINRGTIDVGRDNLLSLQGQNVLLSGGLLNMEGFETGNFFGDTGVFPGYWGLRQTPDYNPVSYFSFFPMSPAHWVTNRYYQPMQQQLYLPLGNAYLNPGYYQGPSNYLWQVVFLRNADRSVSNNVYFPYDSVVEWLWLSTNIITGVISTNSMYLDDGLIQYTNLSLVTNGVAPPNTSYGNTYIPTNYYAGSFMVGQAPFSLGLPASPTVVSGIFGPNKNINSEYTAYDAVLLPTTVIVGEIAGQTYSNMPGRIEITADKQLDLRSSRIAGLNYLRLTATNNFIQDAKFRALTAFADYDLGVTNATLTVSNLLAPTCPRPSGYVNVFSTRWTNIDNSANAFFPGTNTYFVTMVDSYLTNSSPSFLQNLTLHATNVVISDVLNVLSNITIDAYNVTITTNGPGAQTPMGQLNFPSGQPLGTAQFPRLRNLTNNGLISIQNAGAFGDTNQPLWNFVNHGTVQVLGCSIAATNCENSGLIDAGPGPFYLNATTATLTNGVCKAPMNGITLSVGSLFISNHVLNAGQNLTILATNCLTDGGPTSGNVWQIGVLGLSLPFEPPVASLLGTTITDTAPTYTSVPIQWAGQDLGAVAAGYSNNAALGRLILDGAWASSFEVQGAGATNALYVDYLEFRDYMTNFDGSGNLANLQFAPGMKIYYAQLIINGVSWAEKLNHKNDGGLNWVPTYAGQFSCTNMVYPDGTTNKLNLALVQSCDMDSNFNNIANCQDPAPVFVPSQVSFTASMANPPQRAVVLSWNSVPFSTNTLFFKPSFTATNWQVLTNFVLGPVGGRRYVTNSVAASGRVYRVAVDTRAP
jgi:hypothetical protein